MISKAKYITCLILFMATTGYRSSITVAQPSLFLPDRVYQVGVRAMLLKDESRDNRTLQTFIWYPALVTEDTKPPYAPDESGAPYPLVIYSHGYGAASTEARGDIEYLVSQGFVVAGIDHRDPATDRWAAFINRPLDILFLLNRIAELEDDPLADVVNTDTVGIWGGSMGAYTAVAVSGARVDPSHFQDWCPTYENDPNYNLNFDSCRLLSDWDNLLSYHEQVNTPSTDALWEATTDERIRAVLGTAPCFAQMFGETGLAETHIPIFIIGGTADRVCPYDIDSVYIYDNIGSDDRYLVALQDRDHSGAFSEPNLIISYAAAFFGHYLQDKTDYAQYLLPESADIFQNVTLESQLAGQ